MTCPKCESIHIQNCEMIYAQGSSVSYGPDYRTYNISGLAFRVEPPSPPIPPAYLRSRAIRFGIPGAILGVVAISHFLMLLFNKDISAAMFAALPAAVSGYLIWQSWPPLGDMSQDINQQHRRNTRKTHCFTRLCGLALTLDTSSRGKTNES
jgi:hypothetical protein